MRLRGSGISLFEGDDFGCASAGAAQNHTLSFGTNYFDGKTADTSRHRFPRITVFRDFGARVALTRRRFLLLRHMMRARQPQVEHLLRPWQRVDFS